MPRPRKIHSKSRDANVCPCCGHEVDKTKFVIDVPTGVVIFNGMIHAMPRRMGQIIALLWDAYPEAVSNDKMVYEFFAAVGKDEPKSGNGVLDVLISTERRKLREMGIEIVQCRVGGLNGKRLKLTTFDNAKDWPLAPNQHAQLMWGIERNTQ